MLVLRRAPNRAVDCVHLQSCAEHSKTATEEGEMFLLKKKKKNPD